MEGLEEQSKAPKNPALKITEAQRKKAIELKKKMPSFRKNRCRENKPPWNIVQEKNSNISSD